MPLILASSSAIRRAMLAAAGVEFRVLPPGVDEKSLKDQSTPPAETALRLAEAKACVVSATHASDWVIGSDSLVAVNGRRFDKPATREEAARHLRSFSGNTIALTSAAVLARGQDIVWRQAETAHLHVRILSDEFIANYLDAEWPDVGHCVGVFRLEGRGVQLFETIEGDYFTVLGMPLLPLLSALRERGLVAA